MKTHKIISAKEKEFQDKLNEMSQYYGKEINDLRQKLNEANQTVERFRESKNSLQDNLKKALMRGVVAMNLEAMNVLDSDGREINNMNLIDSMIGSSNLNMNATNFNNDNLSNTNNVRIEQLERKVVVKDNNWVNACAVPSKMKSNIISKEIEDENEFEEPSNNRLNNHNFSMNHNLQKPTPYPAVNKIDNSNFHDELTKSILNLIFLII
jgi:hypothetical protein